MLDQSEAWVHSETRCTSSAPTIRYCKLVREGTPPMRSRRWLTVLLGLWFILIIAVLMRVPAALAEPAGVTIVVNTTSDEISNDGHCSLREAIQSANTDTASGAAPGE